MATSPNRVAANRSNARHSTGPKTTEGATQNTRKHPFNPATFAIVRIEDRAQISSLVAAAIATYQLINSQERSAVERIALPQHSILRMYGLEAGFFTNCTVEVTQLDQAISGPAEPFILNRSDLSTGVDIALEQHRAYWLAFGFNNFTRQSNIAATFLRFQAQAERLHRRAVEDFHRLPKLRGQLPPEQYEDPIEPKIEPIPAAQTRGKHSLPRRRPADSTTRERTRPLPATHTGAQSQNRPGPRRDGRPPFCTPSKADRGYENRGYENRGYENRGYENRGSEPGHQKASQEAASRQIASPP